MTAEQFAYVDHERGSGVELYFEDEYIAIDTWDSKRSAATHEILLNARTVDLLIEALTAMKTTIATRAPKES